MLQQPAPAETQINSIHACAHNIMIYDPRAQFTVSYNVKALPTQRPVMQHHCKIDINVFIAARVIDNRNKQLH